MKTRYETFKENEFETWKYRFTWRGLYGDKAYYAVNVLRFFKENPDLLEVLRGVRNVRTFREKLTKLAKEYVKWANKIEPHTDDELNDLKKFFIGGIGEFFFTGLFNDVKAILKVENGVEYRYDFNYTAPRLIGEDDWGVDLTSIVSDIHGDRNCVVQVKFWNPYIKSTIDMDIAASAFTDGVLNNFINPEEEKNIVICWLGDEEKEVSTFLKKNKCLYKHVIFIGKQSLNLTINEKNGIFWDSLVDKLHELASKY